MRAGVALGSNLGDRLGDLRAAVEKVKALGQMEPPFLASGVYETEPVGCEPGAPKFLNAVIEIGYAGDPLSLLRELREIEKALGRTRSATRNTSRTIDLDLLYFGNVEMQTADLELPHPRITDRAFVLKPLADIRPDLILPGQTRSVRELLDGFSDAFAAVRIAEEL